MKENSVILATGIIGLAGCGPEGKEIKKPNIVLILADDMGYECIGAYGNAVYKTPCLDRLASEGVRFTQCHASPLSTPSRVALMTGKYNFRNYKDFGYLDKNEKTFANILKEAGYATCVAGKWQLNGKSHPDKYRDWPDSTRPFHFGFDEYCLWNFTEPDKSNRYAKPVVTCNGEKIATDTADYGEDIFTDFIIRFIDKNKDKPFMVYYPMALVHEPFCSTPSSPDWNDVSTRFVNDTSYFKDMVAYADKMVLKLVNHLEKLNLLENTIFIFTGDNGTLNRIYTPMKDGRIIRGDKGNTTDGGTHVPLIVYYKNHFQKKVSDALIDFPDILPTLCDMAGVVLPDSFITDGKSFLPLLEGKNYTEDEFLYLYYSPKWGPWKEKQFIRNKQYKLYSTGEFYHLEKDLLEKNPIPIEKMTEEEKRIFRKLENELKKYLQMQK